MAALAGILFILLAAPCAGAPATPSMLAPIPDLTIQAGSFNERALDLSAYFAPAAGGGGDYWTVRVVHQRPLAPTDPALFVNGTWLGVAAADPHWTGTAEFRLEACSIQGAMASCTSSNTFTVAVARDGGPTPTPGPTPPGPQIVQGLGGGPGSFLLVFPPGAAPVNAPRWFLDGVFVGEGNSIRLVDLAPGPHRLLALYSTADGSGVLFHDFEAASIPPSAPPSPLPWALAGLLVFAAALYPARSRHLLWVAVVASVHPGLRKHSLLDHFNRGALHQAIKEHPGIHFSELRRVVGLPHGTATFHLHALEQAGIIRARRVGAYTTYTITGETLEPQTYGLTESDQAVLTIVRGAPGISLPELAQRSSRSLGNTSRVVTRLAALGYVTTQRSRRRRLVFPRDDVMSPALAKDEGGTTQ